MMNNNRNSTYALVAAGAVAAVAPACAQETGKVMIDVAECIKLEAAEARLACYESRVAAVFSDRAAQAAVPRPPKPAAAAPVASASPATSTPTTAATPDANSGAPVRAVAVPASPSATTEPAQSQGRGDREIRREEKAQAAEAAAASDIVSRVKELREVLPDAWQITLENGQIWRQTFSKHYELRSGYQVRIYSTRWGSASRLSAEEVKGYIQVERVR
jgi:hypothetical protein